MTEEEVRRIVREEVDFAIASLAGLALRRLQDVQFTRSGERNAASEAARDVFGHLWGEVLSDYGKFDRIEGADGKPVGLAFRETE